MFVFVFVFTGLKLGFSVEIRIMLPGLVIGARVRLLIVDMLLFEIMKVVICDVIRFGLHFFAFVVSFCLFS